jgi:peptidoglycan/LPS O-acetylase OafA/YrhL
MRVKVIDGLRGYAVLLVVLFHYLNNSYNNNISVNNVEKYISQITSYGWIGVNIFFVISGYLIGSILISNRKSTKYFSTFYLRRATRILPLYILFLFVYIVTSKILGNLNVTLFENPIALWNYFIFIQNFAMSQTGSFGPNGLTPSWSLAVEEQFYLVIPLIVFILSERKLLILGTFVIVCSIYFRVTSENWYMEYTHFISRVDALFIGVMLAVVKYTEGESSKRILNLKFVLYFVGFCILSILIFYIKQVNHSLISYAFAGLLLFFMTLDARSILYKIIVNKCSLFLGKYSFFIYLFHQLINGCLFALLSKKNPSLDSLSDYAIEFTALILTSSLAVVSFEHFESKFISLGSKFNYD